MAEKPKIFVWVNSGRGTDWQVGVALAEDGTCLGSHVSSSRAWFRHDMGVTSDWKHDGYREHYPDGYEVVEVSEGEEATHPGLLAAYALNQSKAPLPKESHMDLLRERIEHSYRDWSTTPRELPSQGQAHWDGLLTGARIALESLSCRCSGSNDAHPERWPVCDRCQALASLDGKVSNV